MNITIPQLPDSTQLDSNDFIIVYNNEGTPDVYTYKARIGDVLNLRTISVNGVTGNSITLTADNISDASTTTNKFVSPTEKGKIAIIRTDLGSGVALCGDGVYRAVAGGSGNQNLTVNTISDRDLLTGLSLGDRCLVVDATGDATVSSGAALYWWNTTGSVWSKIAEYESLDFTVTYPVTGAANGLQMKGKNVTLGGALTGNTVIAGGGNRSLTLGDTSRFTDFTVASNNSISHDIYYTSTGAVIRDFMTGVGHTQQAVFGSKSGATMYIGYDATQAVYNGFAVYSSNGYPTSADLKLRISPKSTQLNIQSDGVPILVSKLGADSNVPLLSFKNRNTNNSAAGLTDILLGNNNGGLASGGTGSVLIGNLVANKLSGNSLTLIGIGQGALSSSLITAQSGRTSIAIGTFAMAGSTINDGDNIAIGQSALLGSTLERGNIGIGYEAGNVMSGSSVNFFNVAIGLRSFKTGSGTKNLTLGSESGRFIRGSYNVACGTWSLSNTFGSYNTGVGAYAGFQTTLRNFGSGNTYVGNGASYSSGLTNNMVVIGNNFQGSLSNRIYLGNASQSVILGFVQSGTTSNVLVKETNGEIRYKSISSLVSAGGSVLTGATNGLKLSSAGKKVGLGGSLSGTTVIGIGANNFVVTGTSGLGLVLQSASPTLTYSNQFSLTRNGFNALNFMAGSAIGNGATLQATEISTSANAIIIGAGTSRQIQQFSTGHIFFGSNSTSITLLNNVKATVFGLTNTTGTTLQLKSLSGGTRFSFTDTGKMNIAVAPTVTTTGTTVLLRHGSGDVQTRTVASITGGSVSIASFAVYSGATGALQRDYLKKSAFNIYSGTTEPATYVKKTIFSTYTGTTAPATYQSKSSIGTLTGTTLPAAYSPLDYAIMVLTGATTLSATHKGKIIHANGTFTITLPNSLSAGLNCTVNNIGSGTITLAATTTLNTKSSYTKLASQFGAATIYHAGSNIWFAFGDLSA